MRNASRAFITIDVLIAGMVLVAGIAACMYLFRVGLMNLERANRANLFASKLLQIPATLKATDLERGEGEIDMGDGFLLRYRSRILSSVKPKIETGEGTVPSRFEIVLFEVAFKLIQGDYQKEGLLNVLKTKALPAEF